MPEGGYGCSDSYPAYALPHCPSWLHGASCTSGGASPIPSPPSSRSYSALSGGMSLMMTSSTSRAIMYPSALLMLMTWWRSVIAVRSAVPPSLMAACSSTSTNALNHCCSCGCRWVPHRLSPHPPRAVVRVQVISCASLEVLS